MDKHIFTVDVEEYYHAENICDHVSKEVIVGLPGRVEIGTRKILDLLEAGGHKATFFPTATAPAAGASAASGSDGVPVSAPVAAAPIASPAIAGSRAM